MKCQLCLKDTTKLAKSHIYPIGFFSKIETKGRLDTFESSGKKGRKLQKAIYDSQILCPECESKIAVYDDYAIKIFRDKLNSFEISTPKLPEGKVLVFSNTRKRLLRGFLGSLLWRISKSKQLEVADLSIGEIYEKRIAEDVKNEGDFSYIDVFSAILEQPHHAAFFSPKKFKILPIDQTRDPHSVNGWEITLPNLILRTSLDKRSHPLNFYYNIPPEISGKEQHINASTSLNKTDDYHFILMYTKKHSGYTRELISAYSNKRKRN